MPKRRMMEERKPYEMGKRILNAYYPPEEFYIFIAYAPLGFGKSSYEFKVCAEVLQKVYHLEEKEAWEKLKQFICFHPTQFFEKIVQIEDSKLKRIPFLIWEDMGLWLYAMEWHNPFIEAFVKYLNVARTHLASIVGSSPSPEWVLRRLRRFPSAYTVSIRRVDGKQSHTVKSTWKRTAVGYRFWLHPDLQHCGVRKVWTDGFTCKMPDDFYEWYKPVRDAYEDMALALLREKWENFGKQNQALLLADYPNLSLPRLTSS